MEDFEYMLSVSVLCTEEEATIYDTFLAEAFFPADADAKVSIKRKLMKESREIMWDIGIVTDYIPQMYSLSKLMPRKMLCAKTVCNDGLFYEYFKNGKMVGSTRSLTPDQFEYWSDPVFDLSDIF